MAGPIFLYGGGVANYQYQALYVVSYTIVNQMISIDDILNTLYHTLTDTRTHSMDWVCFSGLPFLFTTMNQLQVRG